LFLDFAHAISKIFELFDCGKVGEMDKEFNYSKLFDLKQETLWGHSLNTVRAR